MNHGNLEFIQVMKILSLRKIFILKVFFPAIAHVIESCNSSWCVSHAVNIGKHL